jgi:hypothetical protein
VDFSSQRKFMAVEKPMLILLAVPGLGRLFGGVADFIIRRAEKPYFTGK